MAEAEERLRLGDSGFVKSRLKRLPQVDETWEADFLALPKPVTQSATHYRGTVVAGDGSVLASVEVRGRPTVNDMAALMVNSMRQPLVGKGRRPRRMLVRGHPQWRELFGHLTEIGIEVGVRKELLKVRTAYEDYLKRRREAYRAGMVKPTAGQRGVEELFPAIALWVKHYGHIEIGDQEMFGFVVRAIEYGGMAFEDDKPDTLAEGMAVLETGLRRWFRKEGFELEE